MTDFTKTFSADLLKTVAETMKTNRDARKSEPTLAERHARDEAIKKGQISEATDTSNMDTDEIRQNYSSKAREKPAPMKFQSAPQKLQDAPAPKPKFKTPAPVGKLIKTGSIAERYGLTELNTGGGTVKNAINQSGLSGPAQSIAHSETEFNNKLQSARKAGKDEFSHGGKTYKTLVKEAAGVDKGAQDKHNCATHVYDKKLGEGLAIYGQHAEPDSNGDIAWYDVMFESGIERVMTEEVIVMMSEEHGNHKKKVVNEQGAHPIEPTGITADSTSLATKRRRPKPVAESSESPKVPDLLGDFLKRNKYVKDAPEAPSAAPKPTAPPAASTSTPKPAPSPAPAPAPSSAPSRTSVNIAKGIRGIGKLAVPAAAGLAAYDLVKGKLGTAPDSEPLLKTTAKITTGVAGSVLGGALGAAAGTLTASPVGGAIAGVTGSVAGYKGGEKAAETGYEYVAKKAEEINRLTPKQRDLALGPIKSKAFDIARTVYNAGDTAKKNLVKGIEDLGPPKSNPNPKTVKDAVNDLRYKLGKPVPAGSSYNSLVRTEEVLHEYAAAIKLGSAGIKLATPLVKGAVKKADDYADEISDFVKQFLPKDVPTAPTVPTRTAPAPAPVPAPAPMTPAAPVVPAPAPVPAPVVPAPAPVPAPARPAVPAPTRPVVPAPVVPATEPSLSTTTTTNPYVPVPMPTELPQSIRKLVRTGKNKPDIDMDIDVEPEINAGTEASGHSILTPLTPGKYNPSMSDSDYAHMWADLPKAQMATAATFNMGGGISGGIGNKRKKKVNKNPQPSLNPLPKNP